MICKSKEKGQEFLFLYARHPYASENVCTPIYTHTKTLMPLNIRIEPITKKALPYRGPAGSPTDLIRMSSS